MRWSTLLALSALTMAFLAVAPTATASGDCTDKETEVGAYEVHVERGDCLRVSYSHPTANCADGYDLVVYSGTIVCNGYVVVL